MISGTNHSGETLRMGTLIDRYGEIYGDYAAPYGTPYEQRSIPYIQNSHAYTMYIM